MWPVSGSGVTVQYKLAQTRPVIIARMRDDPYKGGSRRNITTPFGTEKLEWLGYPMVKKF